MEWFWLCNSIISVSSFSQRSELKHWNPHGNFSTDCCLKSVFVFTSIIILLSVKKRDRYKWVILEVILKNPSCYLMPLLWMAHGLIHQEGYHHSDPLLCLCTGILISGQWIHCGKVNCINNNLWMNFRILKFFSKNYVTCKNSTIYFEMSFSCTSVWFLL